MEFPGDRVNTFVILIHTARLASIVVELICIPTSNQCIFFPLSHQHLVLPDFFFFFSNTIGKDDISIYFLILVFLLMNEIEHHSMCVRAIGMSFSVNFLFSFFAYFSSGLLIFFLPTTRNSVFGVISHLSVM